MASFRLPYPPSTNAIWKSRVIGKGRKAFVSTYLTKVGVQYRRDVQAAILERFGVIKPLRCRLSVRLVVVPPDRRRRDIDNTIKSVFDSLTHAGVWVDDEQIDRIEVIRGPVTKPGWLDVSIERIAAQHLTERQRQ